MKRWLIKHIGVSWQTTLISYLMAILLAVQPFLTEHIDWNSRREVLRYMLRILFAACIAVFGKKAADSHQVKEVDKKVDEHLSE